MNRRAFLPRLGFILGLLAFGGCQSARAPRVLSFQTALPPLVSGRLSLAREVAWTKFHSGAPIHDPVREAALLQGFVDKAASRGIDPGYARRFFSAQLDASRVLQTELIEAWRRGSAPRPEHPPRDLQSDLRPRLDKITAHLADSLPTGDHPPLADLTADDLRREGFSPAVIALATAPLR